MRAGVMMDPGDPYRDDGQRISMDQAIGIVEDYLQDRNDPALPVDEVMEFESYFTGDRRPELYGELIGAERYEDET